MVEIRNPNIEILNKYENQIFKCSKRGLIGHLTGPAGPKAVPRCGRLYVQSEMSIYLRLWAVYRLPAGKHAGILTYFQTKVKKKISHEMAQEAQRDKSCGRKKTEIQSTICSQCKSLFAPQYTHRFSASTNCLSSRVISVNSRKVSFRNP